SRTTSMSRGCAPRPRVRPSPMHRRRMQPVLRACRPRARSSSARPISTSSRPGLPACARPTAFRATRSRRRSFPGDRAGARRPRALDALGPMPDGVRLGVPMAGQREFDGDEHSAAAYDAALLVFSTLGAQITEIDMEPFYRTARLLYEGPWVAERYIAARSVI